jgi:hypothetical protein
VSHDDDALGPILEFRSEIAALDDVAAVHERLKARMTEIDRQAAEAPRLELVHVREGIFAEAAARLGQLGDGQGAVAAAIAWSFWSTRSTYIQTPPVEATYDRTSEALTALSALAPPTMPTPSAHAAWPKPQIVPPPAPQHAASSPVLSRPPEGLVDRSRTEGRALRPSATGSAAFAFRAVDDAVSRVARENPPTINADFDTSATRETE